MLQYTPVCERNRGKELSMVHNKREKEGKIVSMQEIIEVHQKDEERNAERERERNLNKK